MQRIIMIGLGMLLLLPLVGATENDPPKEELIATFSIAAVDPETGTCGAAVASKYPAVGKVVAHARAGVGAFCTQHYGVQKWGEPALDLLAKGKSCEEVFVELLRDDRGRDGRQLAIIDMQGRSALHHPTKAGKGSY